MLNFSKILVFLVFATAAIAQSGWSLGAGQSLTDFHTGTAGGTHEHIEVVNYITPDGKSSEITLVIEYFDYSGDTEDPVVTTKRITIPEGATKSFHGDVKSATIEGAANGATNGTHDVTYP